MTSDLSEYIEAGKQFTLDERLEAAHQLLLSVQQDESDDALGGTTWEGELLRRAEGALDGSATLHDVGESHAQIRAELAATRRT